MPHKTSNENDIPVFELTQLDGLNSSQKDIDNTLWGLSQETATEEGFTVLAALQKQLEFRNETHNILGREVDAYLTQVKNDIEMAIEDLPSAVSAIFESLDNKLTAIQCMLSENERMSSNLDKVPEILKTSKE